MTLRPADDTYRDIQLVHPFFFLFLELLLALGYILSTTDFWIFDVSFTLDSPLLWIDETSMLISRSSMDDNTDKLGEWNDDVEGFSLGYLV